MRAVWDGCDLRQLSAARLLAIRREVMAMGLTDELERSLVGNAMVLAACCEEDGRPVFADGQAVLDRLTAPQMERLLRRLTAKEQESACGEELQDGTRNEHFDEERFLRLKESG